MPRSPWPRRVAYYLTALALAWGMIQFVAQPLAVEGPSMRPTLGAGDEILVFKPGAACREGAIVVARPASLPGRTLVKRVIAGPGRRLEFKDGERWLDGKSAPEPWLAPGFKDLATLPERALGSDDCFLAGDNRRDSSDSRDPLIGPVKKDELVGRVIFRLWPPGRVGRPQASAPEPPVPVTAPAGGKA